MVSQKKAAGKAGAPKQSQSQGKKSSQASQASSSVKRKKAPAKKAPRKRAKPNRIEDDEDEDEEDDDSADRPALSESDDDEDDEDDVDSDEEYDVSLSEWLKDPRKKKPHGPYYPFHKAAQWIMRAHYPFAQYHKVWTVYRWGRKGAYFNYETERRISKEEFHRLYVVELRLLEVLQIILVDFDEDVGSLKRSLFPKLAQAMNNSASRARGDDIKSLKVNGINYTVRICAKWYADNPWAALMDPLGRKEVVRGPRDPLALYLLLPPAVTEEYRADWETHWQSFSDRVISGKIKITGHELPRVLFNGLDYDPDDLQCGLFLSKLLMAVWKHLFLSPSTAIENDPKPVSKASQAGKHGMTEVSANSIAYAALHVCAVLSLQSSSSLLSRSSGS